MTLFAQEREEGERKPSMLDDKMDEALLKTRRIFFSDAVDNNTARDAIRRLLYLEHVAPGKPILFIINSPGGSVDAGFAIWDQIKLISSPVITLVTGIAASMGSILSLCAAPGKRLATPNARIMIHQPAINSVVRGQATDLEIQAQEILKMRKKLINIYVEATGKNAAEIEKSIDRDTWMTVEEAKKFKLIDKVVSSYKEIESLF